MGFFEHLKKSVVKPLEKVDLLNSTLPLEAGNFSQLYSACVGYSHARQLLFGEQIVKDRDWNVDFSTGTITFGEDAYPIQLLGSESDSSNTWLWSWANLQSGLSEDICSDAVALKTAGEEKVYTQLTEAEFDFTGFATPRGHAVATVAAALNPEHVCYYRCPYNGGAAYVLVKNIPASVWIPLNPQQVVSAISQVLQSLGGELNHKLLVLGLAAATKLGTMESGKTISLQFRNASPVTVDFDGIGRIVSIHAELSK